MVRSGSKGSMVNILQIMACVGQQNVSENACKPLSQIEHFQCSSHLTTLCVPEDLSHSYIDGLTPDEYWHHTVGGREGLIDTAVKTSTTGYIQRRLVKSLESIHVDTDKTVRDSQNRILQFIYGEDGMDGMAHEMVHCDFDDKDTLPPEYYDWPEIQEAFDLLVLEFQNQTWRKMGGHSTSRTHTQKICRRGRHIRNAIERHHQRTRRMHCESSTSKGLCTVGFWQKNT